ncbi:putative signal transducing protein [Prosthecobacter sp.]|uniref:putative signal transducing protein n=1 Tax=Prosthecobacter sp. TaxID=1965333 RepID=UPI00378513FB
MRDLITSLDSARLGFYKSILDEAGIVSFIRNETTAQLTNIFIGPLQPTLCLVDEADFEQASALLRPHQMSDETHFTAEEDWLCPACKESNPASFEVCWKCQTAKPE